MQVALDPSDTIAALATPPGAGARAIVRLSGPRALVIASAGFTSTDCYPDALGPTVEAGTLAIEGLGRALPVRLGRWRGPRSYTGQDLAEIHLVGSPPLVDLLLSQLVRRGARLAERGEFTLRAFLAGKLDLTQAEAVLAVIHARGPGDLEQALERLAGGLAHPLATLRDRLLDLAAGLEAGLDFSEEPDVSEVGRVALAAELSTAAGALVELTKNLRDRDRPLDHPRVVLVGPPNAGKSSLFNALVGADRAIVAPEAGTTRDYLTATLDVGGMRVELIDTAGIEPADDVLPARAQALRDLQAQAADLVLDCRSAGGDGESRWSRPDDRLTIKVWTKADLAPLPTDDDRDWVVTSATNGVGIGALGTAIGRALEEASTSAQMGLEIGARARQGVAAAALALDRASQALALGAGDEIVVFDVHLAIDELGRVLGRVVDDDVLDRVFSRFCIGK